MEERETQDISSLDSDQIVRLVMKMLAENAVAAVRALREIATDPATPVKHRCRAAETLLNRVYGRAGQPMDEACGLKREPLVFEFTGELPDTTSGSQEAEIRSSGVQEFRSTGEGNQKPEAGEREAGGGSAAPPPEASAIVEEGTDVDPEVERELIEGSCDAARTLIELASDPEQPPGVRCRAAEAILDRVCGRASRLIRADGPVEIQFKGVLADWAR